MYQTPLGLGKIAMNKVDKNPCALEPYIVRNNRQTCSHYSVVTQEV